MFSDQRQNQLIEFCRDLIKTPSFSGQESEVIYKLYNIMKLLNFDETIIDKYGSLIGRIKGNKPGKTLLLDGHVDTVDASDVSLWEYDPFGAEMVDGRIYGRGTTDMKGAFVSNNYGSCILF